MCRLALALAFALAACGHSKPAGPAWPAPSTTAEDGGESLDPQPGYAAAVEKSEEPEPAKEAEPAPEEEAKKEEAKKEEAAPEEDASAEPAASEASESDSDETDTTDDLMIEIDDEDE